MKNLLLLVALSSIFVLNAFTKDVPTEVQYSQYYDELPNVANCNPGRLKQSVIDEVIAKVNQIRILHKLPPVTYEYDGQQMSMEGSLNMVASGKGGHVDDPSTPCYTPAAGEARMKSNIEYGSGGSTPVGSIIGWMIDDHNADVAGQYKVGHRRAFLNPFLKKYSFGRADGAPVGGGFFSASCFLYQDFTYGDAQGMPNDFVAYPYEYYPPDMVNKAFYLSFNAVPNKNSLWENQKVSYASATVTMTDENGKTVNVHSIGNDNEGWGSFPNNISWKADGLVDEVQYNVSVNNVLVNGSPKNYSYWFKLTNISHVRPPEIPKPQIPANMAKSIGISSPFTWSQTYNTSKYHLQVSKNEAFTQLLVNNSNITTNGFVVSDLEYESQYWWRVASSNDAGTSDWSEVFSFTTTTPTPDRPYLAGPANNTVLNTTTPRLHWTSVPGAETYSLQISRDDTFVGFSVRYTKSFITDTFDIVPAARLSNETDYWWRVKAVNAGGESTYTPSWKFNTGLPLPAPVLTGPSNQTETTMTPTLTWNVVPGAVSYDIQVSEVEGFDKGFIVEERKWADISYTIESNKLTDGKTYYWRVRANSESGTGPFSESMSFMPKAGASIFDTKLSNDLEVYPNPVKDLLYISINNKQIIDRIVIRDLLGNEIGEIFGNERSSLLLNTSNYNSGIYFITVYSGNDAFTNKVSIIK